MGEYGRPSSTEGTAHDRQTRRRDMDRPVGKGPPTLLIGQRWAVDHRTHDGRSYPITVAVIGTQYDDGRIQRRIVVDVPVEPITAAQGQEFDSGVDCGRSDPRHRGCVSRQRRGMTGPRIWGSLKKFGSQAICSVASGIRQEMPSFRPGFALFC